MVSKRSYMKEEKKCMKLHFQTLSFEIGKFGFDKVESRFSKSLRVGVKFLCKELELRVVEPRHMSIFIKVTKAELTQFIKLFLHCEENYIYIFFLLNNKYRILI